MSTLNITDLLRELQAGEEARAKIPQLQEAVNAHADRADKLAAHNQGLETSIIDYKRTIDGLNAKVRSLEVERDDAGFRELEMQDKLNTVVSRLMGVFKDVDETLAYANPPKPEPVAQETVQAAGMSVNVPITDHSAGPGVESNPAPQGQSATDPIPASSTPAGETSATTTASPDATLGQSDPRPTAPLTEATLPFASGADASPSAPAPSTNDPQAYRPFGGDAVGAAKPNEGRGYYRKPYNMSDADWYASGGLSF